MAVDLASAGRFEVSDGRARLLSGKNPSGDTVGASACVSKACDESCAQVHIAPGPQLRVVVPSNRGASLDELRLMGLVVACSVLRREEEDAA